MKLMTKTAALPSPSLALSLALSLAPSLALSLALSLTLALVLAVVPAAALCGCASSSAAPKSVAGSNAESELAELLRARSGTPSEWSDYQGRGFRFRAPAGLVPDGLGMFDPDSPMALGGLQGSVRILWEIGPGDTPLRPGAGSEKHANIVPAQIAGRRVWVEDGSSPSGEISAYFEPNESGYALTFIIAAPDLARDDLLELAAHMIRSIRFR